MQRTLRALHQVVLAAGARRCPQRQVRALGLGRTDRVETTAAGSAWRRVRDHGDACVSSEPVTAAARKVSAAAIRLATAAHCQVGELAENRGFTPPFTPTISDRALGKQRLTLALMG